MRHRACSTTSSERLVASSRTVLVVAGAVAFAGGGLVAAWSMRSTPASPPALAPVAAAIEARVRAARDDAGARAAGLAAEPLLAAAVATDESTVRDLAGREISFRPRANERLEIAQIDRAS